MFVGSRSWVHWLMNIDCQHRSHRTEKHVTLCLFCLTLTSYPQRGYWIDIELAQRGFIAVLELSRIVSQDCTVHFVFENIGPGGHYRGFIEPITDLDTDFRKVVSLFGSGLYNWKPVIDIDETLYNSPECKTIIDALKQCTTGTQLMQSDDFKRELALHGFVNPL